MEANNRVSAIVRVGDGIYLGGSFTELKSKDGQIIARTRLATIDANTGGVADWNPEATGSVRTLALSPDDGCRLYIGGGFTNVGSPVRNCLAAIDLASKAYSEDLRTPMFEDVEKARPNSQRYHHNP